MSESLNEIVKDIYTTCPFCNDGVKYYLTCTPTGWPINITCKCGARGDWYSIINEVKWERHEVKATKWIKGVK